MQRKNRKEKNIYTFMRRVVNSRVIKTFVRQFLILRKAAQKVPRKELGKARGRISLLRLHFNWLLISGPDFSPRGNSLFSLLRSASYILRRKGRYSFFFSLHTIKMFNFGLGFQCQFLFSDSFSKTFSSFFHYI